MDALEIALAGALIVLVVLVGRAILRHRSSSGLIITAHFEGDPGPPPEKRRRLAEHAAHAEAHSPGVLPEGYDVIFTSPTADDVPLKPTLVNLSFFESASRQERIRSLVDSEEVYLATDEHGLRVFVIDGERGTLGELPDALGMKIGERLVRGSSVLARVIGFGEVTGFRHGRVCTDLMPKVELQTYRLKPGMY